MDHKRSIGIVFLFKTDKGFTHEAEVKRQFCS